MEHRLILGGHQYLPFARSRVKALRATGLKYATQRFIMPGGEHVRIQITGEHEYIEISGGGCSVPMDAGIVNVWSIAEFAAETYLPGILHYSELVTNLYDAPIGISEGVAEFLYNGRTSPPKGVGQVEWRKVSPLLSVSNASQVANYVTKSGNALAGKAPFDAKEAWSFSSLATEADPPTDPRTWTYAENDAAVRAKKRLAILCPPSIFTGKCRLWVQAIYGRPLYGESGSADTLPELVNDTSAATAIRIRPYIAPGDETVYPSVLIDTSCGVHMDGSGNHWLFCPTGGGVVRVYPLKAGKCAESLRELLSTTGFSSGAPRTRLEAFILSDSRPDIANVRTISNGTDFAPYSLGYGWHWNWDGLVADIVINETFTQDETNAAMRSTHYRMTMSQPTPSTWAAATTVIEGPTDWSVPRGSWCIVEPDYADMVLSKATPSASTRFECDAPFYAFYKGNVVQVCRVTVGYQGAESPTREMSDSFAASYVYQASDVNYATLGDLEGYLEESPNSGTSYTAIFTCGDMVSERLYEGFSRTGYRTEIISKVLVSYAGPTVPPDPHTVTGFGDYTFSEGYPEDGVWATVTKTLNFYDVFTGQYTYDWPVTTFTETYSGLAAIVVPFYDSEAIYMRTDIGFTRRDVGTMSHMDATIAGVLWRTRYLVDVYDGGVDHHEEEIIYYRQNNGGGAGGTGHTVSSTEAIDETVTTNDVVAKLVCKAGTVDATFSHVSEFHNNALDTVGANFATLSGTSLDTPLVIAPDIIDATGHNDAPTTAVALVGWV